MRITLDQILDKNPCWAVPQQAYSDCFCSECVRTKCFIEEHGRTETRKEAFFRTAKELGLDKYLDVTVEEWNMEDVLHALRGLNLRSSAAWVEYHLS